MVFLVRKLIHLFGVAAVILAAGCGARFTRIEVEAPRAVSQSSPEPSKDGNGETSKYKLTGNVNNLADGQNLDLGQDGGLVTVLQFASDGCLFCADEAKQFRDHLKDPGVPPTKIRLITVLVATDPLDGADWKARLNIKWEIGLDPELKLLRKYCARDVVPCLVVHSPEKGILLSHNGPIDKDFSLADILKLTGAWE